MHWYVSNSQPLPKKETSLTWRVVLAAPLKLSPPQHQWQQQHSGQNMSILPWPTINIANITINSDELTFATGTSIDGIQSTKYVNQYKVDKGYLFQYTYPRFVF